MPHRDLRVLAFRWFVACGIVGLLSVPAKAQNDVELSWEAPPQCPQRHAVEERLRAILGSALRKSGRLRAEGRIWRVDGRYRLMLAVRDRGEVRERTMESDSCVDLAGAAAVALGLLVRQAESPSERANQPEGTGPSEVPRDGAGVGEGESPANDPARGRDTVPNDAEPAPKEPKAEAPAAEPPKAADSSGDAEDSRTDDGRAGDHSRASAHFRPLLRLPLAALDAGSLPKASFGFGGGLGVFRDGWRLVGSGRIIFEQTWLIAAGSSRAGALVGRAQAELSVCRGIRSGRFEVAPCLVAGLDRISARGTGPGVTARSTHALSFVFGGAGAAHFQILERTMIFASFGVLVETSRPRLVVEGLGEIGHVGPVQVSAVIGPEWIF